MIITEKKYNAERVSEERFAKTYHKCGTKGVYDKGRTVTFRLDGHFTQFEVYICVTYCANGHTKSFCFKKLRKDCTPEKRYSFALELIKKNIEI